MTRDRRRIAEGTVAAALFGGAPSTLHALLSQRSVRAAGLYVLEATRSIGTLVPPGRPGLARGVVAHVAISTACASVLARTLPDRGSAIWGAGAGLAIGLVNVGVIGRRFPAIRALPLVPQLGDHIAFGALFALVADRGVAHPSG